jgi:HK97 family phage prohead protease
MRFYGDIQKHDAETRMVWGYASTEAIDRQGEIVTNAAVEDALAEYMQFANIREMHQLSAVGTAQEVTVDDRGLYIAAHVVDDAAWAKVVAGVYKGFSIGGKVLKRDPDNRKRISKIRLSEISLVDRPANPESVFDVYKLADAEVADDETAGAVDADPIAKAQEDAAAVLSEVMETLGRIEKAEAARAVPAVLEQGIELRKGMSGVARLGGLLAELSYSIFDAELESQIEGDNSPVPEKLRGAFRALADAYKAMSDEEVAELVASVGGNTIAMAATVALTDLAKAAGELPEAEAGVLANAVKPFIAKGMVDAGEVAKLGDLVQKMEGDNVALSEKLTKVQADNDTLLKTVGELTDAMRRLNARVEQLAETPMPPKAASAHAAHALSKAEDTSGHRHQSGGGLSEADVVKVLSAVQALPEEKRNILMMKAAQAKPMRVSELTNVVR